MTSRGSARQIPLFQQLLDLSQRVSTARPSVLAAANELRERYIQLLQNCPNSNNDSILTQQTDTLRRMVIDLGVPDDSEEENKENSSIVRVCSLRGIIWKILLGSVHIDAAHYIQLVECGPTWMDTKIMNDVFRTFRTSKEFWTRVDNSKLSRVLNGFVRLNFTPADQSDVSLLGGYTQGMNCVCGMMLYTLPEVDAFYAFNALLLRHCPRYILRNLDGVYAGCEIVDRLLEIVDPELYTHLCAHMMSESQEGQGTISTIFGVPIISSLLTVMKPMSEVAKIWDFLFAAGIHLTVVACVVIIVLMREKLLQEQNPMKYLIPRSISDSTVLYADEIVACVKLMLQSIPEQLQTEIIEHAFVAPTANSSNQPRCVNLVRPSSPTAARVRKQAVWK